MCVGKLFCIPQPPAKTLPEEIVGGDYTEMFVYARYSTKIFRRWLCEHDKDYLVR